MEREVELNLSRDALSRWFPHQTQSRKMTVLDDLKMNKTNSIIFRKTFKQVKLHIMTRIAYITV